MNSVTRNLLFSCVMAAAIGAFVAYKFWTFGPSGMTRRPLAAGGPSATSASVRMASNLPRIDETHAELKDEIAEIVAGQRREVNPFHTEYFVPPPPPPPPPPPEPEPEPEPEPPPPPPPPPPTTREIVLRYQGFFETTTGERRAYLRKEEKVQLVSAEEIVVDGWKVEEILPRALVLSGADGEERRLEFNKDQKLEVSIEKK